MKKLTILGAGNIGSAMAKGLVASGKYNHSQITLTRRDQQSLAPLTNEGFTTETNNIKAIADSDGIILAVQPQQLVSLLKEISSSVNKGQVVISVVTGVSINEISEQLNSDVSVIRAMPNTAVAIGESMTCISGTDEQTEKVNSVCSLFDCVGKTLVISENHMTQATALAACGVAFFLRSIRAATQGGIEIGFHSNEASLLAAQTARGAASLLLNSDNHPESEIDKVTTPRGCTIAGLNEMEHRGFSSAMIKGILTSAEIAEELFKEKE